jgi:hypothetical protein
MQKNTAVSGPVDPSILTNSKVEFPAMQGDTGVFYVREIMNFTGKGLKIGIIDTGIDYTHPALGGCFGEGCRVAHGWDFAGEDGKGTQDGTPMDCGRKVFVIYISSDYCRRRTWYACGRNRRRARSGIASYRGGA